MDRRTLKSWDVIDRMHSSEMSYVKRGCWFPWWTKPWKVWNDSRRRKQHWLTRLARRRGKLAWKKDSDYA